MRFMKYKDVYNNSRDVELVAEVVTFERICEFHTSFVDWTSSAKVMVAGTSFSRF